MHRHLAASLLPRLSLSAQLNSSGPSSRRKACLNQRHQTPTPESPVCLISGETGEGQFCLENLHGWEKVEHRRRNLRHLTPKTKEEDLDPIKLCGPLLEVDACCGSCSTLCVCPPPQHPPARQLHQKQRQELGVNCMTTPTSPLLSAIASWNPWWDLNWALMSLPLSLSGHFFKKLIMHSL